MVRFNGIIVANEDPRVPIYREGRRFESCHPDNIFMKSLDMRLGFFCYVGVWIFCLNVATLFLGSIAYSASRNIKTNGIFHG
jgi:hypothetical protein